MSARWFLVSVAAGLLTSIAFLTGPAATLWPGIPPTGPPRPPTRPQPVRTHPEAPEPHKIDKQKLIIEQNPECWTGVPGQTCHPGTRTYS